MQQPRLSGSGSSHDVHQTESQPSQRLPLEVIYMKNSFLSSSNMCEGDCYWFFMTGGVHVQRVTSARATTFGCFSSRWLQYRPTSWWSILKTIWQNLAAQADATHCMTTDKIQKQKFLIRILHHRSTYHISTSLLITNSGGVLDLRKLMPKYLSWKSGILNIGYWLT